MITSEFNFISLVKLFGSVPEKYRLPYFCVGLMMPSYRKSYWDHEYPLRVYISITFYVLLLVILKIEFRNRRTFQKNEAVDLFEMYVMYQDYKEKLNIICVKI